MRSRGKAGPKLGDLPKLRLGLLSLKGDPQVPLKVKHDLLQASSFGVRNYTSAVLVLEQKAGNSRQQRQTDSGTSWLCTTLQVA